MEEDSQASYPLYCEIFKGIFVPILITGIDKEYIQRIAKEFCSSLGLPYGKVELGIHCVLSPENTPDGNWGVVVSIWLFLLKNQNQNQKKETNYIVEKLKNQLDLLIRTRLFPRMGISIYSISSINNREINFEALEPIDTFSSIEYLMDFGDGKSSIIKKNLSELVNIPMMGGNFLIESEFPIFEGRMGANLLLFLEHLPIKKIIELEEKIIKFLLNYPKVCLIWGLIRSGSKHGYSDVLYSENLKIMKKHPISSRLQQCLEVQETLKFPNASKIVEIVINGFDKQSLEQALRVLYLKLNGEYKINYKILKLEPVNFNGLFGNEKIFLENK